MLAELYACGSQEVVDAASLFWLQADQFNTAATTALAIGVTDGPGDELQAALEVMTAEKDLTLSRLNGLERLVGRELRSL
jgi:hypothetical protein